MSEIRIKIEPNLYLLGIGVPGTTTDGSAGSGTSDGVDDGVENGVGIGVGSEVDRLQGLCNELLVCGHDDGHQREWVILANMMRNGAEAPMIESFIRSRNFSGCVCVGMLVLWSDQ